MASSSAGDDESAAINLIDEKYFYCSSHLLISRPGVKIINFNHYFIIFKFLASVTKKSTLAKSNIIILEHLSDNDFANWDHTSEKTTYPIHKSEYISCLTDWRCVGGGGGEGQ